MDKEHLPATDLSIESELVSFTLDHVRAYEELNAPTLEEADARFIAELTKVVEEIRVGERIGSGYFYTVHELEDDNRVVIKRLRTCRAAAETSLTQEWGRIQNDHQTILTYFGKKFTPDTNFLLLDHGLRLDNDRQNAQSPHREYVTIQERAHGQKFSSFQVSGHPSSELKAAAVEYIIRYERMLRDGRVMDHPDDLMINDTPDASRWITILDTNMVGSFVDIVNDRNPKIFLEEFGIDAASIKKPENIIQILHNIIPPILGLQTQQAKEFRTLDYPTLMNELREGTGRTYGRLLTTPTLRRAPSNLECVPEELRGNQFLDQLLFSGLRTLISTADRFAVEGHHAQEVVHIMETLGVTDIDLQQFVIV